MTALFSLLPPLLTVGLCIAAYAGGADVYAVMTAGAKKGLRLTADILPALLVLFPMIYLLRASGLPELMSRVLDPLLRLLGIPSDTALLILLRPISGSGALSAAADIIERSGADSLVGRTAAVMIGSSETTFYVISVYFSAAGVRDTRWALIAALCADIACFVSSAWICGIMYG